MPSNSAPSTNAICATLNDTVIGGTVTANGSANPSVADMLAEETWLAILHWVALDLSTGRGATWLTRCSATCRTLHRICNEPTLWRAAFMSINGNLGFDPKGHWPDLHELSPSTLSQHHGQGQGSTAAPRRPLSWRTVVKEQVLFNQTWRAPQAGQLEDKDEDNDTDKVDLAPTSTEVEGKNSLSIHPAPFSTTVLGLHFPLSYFGSANVGSLPRRLNKIDSVRTYMPPPDKPHHQPLIAIVADWAPVSASTTGNQEEHDSDDESSDDDEQDPTSDTLFRIAHVLDANTYDPILTFPLTYRHPQSHQLDHYNLLAIDHQSLIVLFQDDDECEAHLIKYRDEESGIVDTFQRPPPSEMTATPVILPGSPSFAPIQAHLHPDGNYRFFIRATWIPQLVIQRRSSTTLAHLFGGDTYINTRCICFFYQPDLPDVIVTGDRRGAVHVWSIETGSLLYAYQAGTMAFVTFTMFRPWLRPALAPDVVSKDKWLQVFSLVRGMPLDFTNPPGTSLHCVPAASVAAPIHDLKKEAGQASSEVTEEFEAFVEMMDAAAQGGITASKGVAWVGGESGVTEGTNQPCYLYRERPVPLYRRKAYVAAWNLMLVIDVAGRAFTLDMVTGKEGDVFASVGVTVDNVERLLAAEEKSERKSGAGRWRVKTHQLDGEQLVRSVTLPNSKILERKPNVQPRVRCDLMFLDSAWERLLLYRGNTVIICVSNSPPSS